LAIVTSGAAVMALLGSGMAIAGANGAQVLVASAAVANGSVTYLGVNRPD